MIRNCALPAAAIAAFVALGISAASGWLLQSPGVNVPAITPLPVAAPFPADNPTTREKAELGKLIFFDARLSGDNKMSCATCHIPEKGFTDGLRTARGRDGKPLSRNTPTLLNVAFHTKHNWDGRAASLEEQALIPIRAEDEMNQDLEELVRELRAVPEYVRQFQSVFASEVTLDGITKALAAFQRTLITRNSPFDRYLAGDESAISDQAREGWRLFREADCIRCHNGPALSDNQFYRIGIGHRDAGRGGVTGKREEMFAFRTPSLRNVGETAPYMHDGSVRTLEEAVALYFRATLPRPPLGLTLDIEPLAGRSFSEIAPIVAFLHTLTDEQPELPSLSLPRKSGAEGRR